VQTPKPDGAFDGRGFTVTGAMTSLTGASGEDFASILHSLGYRMDRRAKPPEAKPAEPAETPVTEIAPVPEAGAPAEVTSSLSLLPETDLIPPLTIEPVPAELAPSEPAPLEMAAPEPPAAAPSATAEAPVAEAGAAEPAAAEAESKPAAAEPAMIEVWRPGGRTEKRPHRPRRPQRLQQAPAPVAATGEAAAAAPADATTPAPAAEGAETARGPRPPRHDLKDRQQRQERHERQQRMERQNKSFAQRGERQGGGPPRGDRPRRDKGSQVERAEREQYYAKPFGGGGRSSKEPDPNSPFAKLAALKAQLEQKDRP
jgi:ATP-dependent RNA helicase SUPV3L1/SUV3